MENGKGVVVCVLFDVFCLCFDYSVWLNTCF